jgi:hypothetical protein
MDNHVPAVRRGRGRPRIHATEAERRAAAQASWARSRQKRKNISIAPDLVDKLNAAADSLASELGFRPNLSQTLHYLLQNFRKPGQATLFQE